MREAALVPPRSATRPARTLEAICMKAMAARPEDRYASAGPWPTIWRDGWPTSRSRRIAKGSRSGWGGGRGGTGECPGRRGRPGGRGGAGDDRDRGRRSGPPPGGGRPDAGYGSPAAERAAKAEAEANLTLARQAVDDYFTKISENALLKRQDAAEVRDLRTLRKELLEVALAYYNRLVARRSSDPALRSEQAAAYTRVGRINGEIGSKEAALAAYRAGPARSGRTWRHMHPGDAARHASWPRARSRLPACSAIGRAAEALTEYAGAGGSWSGWPTPTRPTSGPSRSWLGFTTARGIVFRSLGRPKDAVAAFDGAGCVVKRMADAGIADTDDQSRLATVHSNIGLLLYELGRTGEAVAALEKSRLICQRLADAYPTGSKLPERPGGLLQQPWPDPQRCRPYAEALAALARGREILERLVSAHPSVTVYRRDLATNHINSGNAHAATNHPGEALPEFERAARSCNR